MFESYVMQSGTITNVIQVTTTSLSAVPESDKVTLFAPDNEAFQLLTDFGYTISSNRTHLDMVSHSSDHPQ